MDIRDSNAVIYVSQKLHPQMGWSRRNPLNQQLWYWIFNPEYPFQCTEKQIFFVNEHYNLIPYEMTKELDKLAFNDKIE